MPAISVIIAVLNGTKTLAKAIQAAQSQTVKDIEIVVVDDGSTDGTYDFVRALADKDPRIVPLRLPQNVGPASARNAGFREAKGTWIAILDADDWMEPNRLELMLKAVEKTGADVVCDNMQFFDHALGRVIDTTNFGTEGHYTPLTVQMAFELDNPFRRTSIGYLQPMFRRAYLEEHRLAYDVHHRVGEDFLLLAEVLLTGGKAILIPEATYIYVHMVSPTTRKKAPTSNTRNGADSIVRASDELLTKYGARMTPDERSALLQRKGYFQTLFLGRVMLQAVAEKDYVKAIKTVLCRPQILLLVIVSATKLLYAQIRSIRQV